MNAMKRFLIAATLAAAALSTPAAAQVSVSIGQPGFYGRIDIGGYPAPALIYPEPMIIRPAPVAVAPLYLRVPPATPRTGDAIATATAPAASGLFRSGQLVPPRPRYQERHGHRKHDRDYRDGYRDGRRDGNRHDDRGGRGGRGDRDDRGPGHGQGRGRD
jgi:hypothetical protein